jgi:hypothetical protein
LQSDDELIARLYINSFEAKNIGKAGYAYLVLGNAWILHNDKDLQNNSG